MIGEYSQFLHFGKSHPAMEQSELGNVGLSNPARREELFLSDPRLIRRCPSERDVDLFAYLHLL